MGGQKSKINFAYNGEDMMLYWVSGSPACFRAMIALEEKKLSGYKQKHLNYLENEHKGEEVLKLNPRGQIPTFHHNGQVVNESMAICEYIQHLFPKRGTSFTVDDKKGFRLMLQRKYEAPNLQKKVEEVVYYIKEKNANVDKDELEKRKKGLFAELKIWDDNLKQVGGEPYLASQQFSLADLAFFPYLAFCVQFGLSLDQRLPNLTSYYARTCRREAVQRAWPQYWKMPVPEDQLHFVGV
jgi:glutathione S-transferase